MKEFLFTSPFFTRFDWGLLIFFASLLVLAVIFILLARRNKKRMTTSRLLARIFRLCFTIFILGALATAMRYFSIPYLGSRFVSVLILTGFLAWLVFILKYAFIAYPVEKRAEEQRALKEKYL